MARFILFFLVVTSISLAALYFWQNRLESFSYEASNESFTNPERGFYTAVNLFEPQYLNEVRQKGFSIGHAFILLSQFRDRPLSSEFLVALGNGLEQARNNNIKIIIRFAYSDTIDAPDADIKTVLEHIKQLKPIFNKYQDIIMLQQAGFIGAWGEWHSSSNNLLASKYKIIEALLNSLPSSRMIALRNPNDLLAIYPKALNNKQAFNSSFQARVGFHNDCFLANQHDAGTYFPADKQESLRKYVKQLSSFTLTGGETCSATPNEQRTACNSTLKEMTEMHWDYLNYDFYKAAIERWQQEGCLTEISNRLGYRLSIVEIKTLSNIKQAQNLKFEISLHNSGFGKVYNPRKIELILRDIQTGQEFHFEPNSNKYSRLLLPLAGKQQSIKFKLDTANLPLGQYQTFLNLADPLLADKPLYSIRLANTNTWEEQTGYNNLNIALNIVSKTN